MVIISKKRSGVLLEPQLTEGLDSSDSDQSILESHCNSCNYGEDCAHIDILVVSDQSYQNTCHIIRREREHFTVRIRVGGAARGINDLEKL